MTMALAHEIVRTIAMEESYGRRVRIRGRPVLEVDDEMDNGCPVVESKPNDEKKDNLAANEKFNNVIISDDEQDVDGNKCSGPDSDDASDGEGGNENDNPKDTYKS